MSRRRDRCHPLWPSKRGFGGALLAGVAMAVAPPAQAEQVLGMANIQQDAFVASDGGGYTSGLFAARLRTASPGESGVASAWLLQPVARWFGGPAPTVAVTSFGQIMLTPGELSRSPPDANDSPYLGAAFVRAAHVKVVDDVADLYALSLGVIGPASGAAQTQRFVHRLTGSTEPRGWDHQVSSRALIGVERYRSWRMPLRPAAGSSAAWDVIGSAGGTLGTLETSVGASVLLRYGRGLTESFALVSRVGSRNGDPVAPANGWFGYASVALDRNVYLAGFDSSRPSTASARRSQNLVAAGVAYGWKRASLTFSLQSASPVVEGSRKRQSWGSLTWTWILR